VNDQQSQKVTASHLQRKAYLYVRQSTLRQVYEHAESTKRQYALQQRAVALGWTAEQIVIIDNDLGQSGASAVDRAGFQRLVADVSLGQAGIVLGLEVSRLARNSADWHRLLELCALTDTLILDEDGIYDPASFNDRLLLGLKGTMSEAELHILQARMQCGVLNKAKRGELTPHLPMGLVYDEEGRVILDPDSQVQDCVRLVFTTFRRSGSAYSVIKHFKEQKLLFPCRPLYGPRRGELYWIPLQHAHVVRMLHNPRYAGAFAFGRTRGRKKPGAGRATSSRPVPREQWHALIQGAHPGYITWDEYEENLRRLEENARAHVIVCKAPPREGPALLQGLALCGVCGKKMVVRYHQRKEKLVPDYLCQYSASERLEKPCQSIPGQSVDATVSELLLEAVTPLALETSLAVEAELQARLEEADRLRQQQVERARYEARLAGRRYLQVDPDNRLVADVLEAEWNQKLRDLAAARLECEQRQAADRRLLDEQQRNEVRDLAASFPRIWTDPRTPDRERKRLMHLMLEDVTLLRGDEITLHVRFKGGLARTLKAPLALNGWKKYQTAPEVIEQIDRLLDEHGRTGRGHTQRAGARFRPAADFQWRDGRRVAQTPRTEEPLRAVARGRDAQSR
jgi:DNA invertase Pin-like site-specific DNA recombinase